MLSAVDTFSNKASRLATCTTSRPVVTLLLQRTLLLTHLLAAISLPQAICLRHLKRFGTKLHSSIALFDLTRSTIHFATCVDPLVLAQSSSTLVGYKARPFLATADSLSRHKLYLARPGPLDVPCTEQIVLEKSTDIAAADLFFFVFSPTFRLELNVGRGNRRGPGTPVYHHQQPDPFRIASPSPPASQLAHLDVSQVTDFRLPLPSRHKAARTARHFCNAADRFVVLGTLDTRGCQALSIETQRTAHPPVLLGRATTTNDHNGHSHVPSWPVLHCCPAVY